MNSELLAGCPDPSCAEAFPVDGGLAWRRVCCPRCGAEGAAIPASMKAEMRGRGPLREMPQLTSTAVVAVLEDVRSIHNVGSIVRSADAFSLELVVMVGITATPEHPRLKRTALGADEVVPWVWRPDGASAVEELRRLGLAVVALERTPSASGLDGARVNRPFALVVGNEVAGVSSPVLDRADHHFEIPMGGLKSSLNASVAFGIAAWALCRPEDPV